MATRRGLASCDGATTPNKPSPGAGIAKAGYACDRAEFIAGLIAVAVPVRDGDGSVRAAIAVHAPEARMSLRRAVGQLAAMRTAAKRMQPLL